MTSVPSRQRVHHVAVVLLSLLVLPLLGAGGGKQKIIKDFSKIEKMCHDFHAVTPPPPPVEAVLVGTLDYASGTFTWGPKVYDKTDKPDLVIDLASPFANLQLDPIHPNLDPKITSLGTAWGNGPNVTTWINSALMTNIGANVGGGATGVVGSGATSAPPTAPTAAPAPAPRGRTPAVAPKGIRQPAANPPAANPAGPAKLADAGTINAPAGGAILTGHSSAIRTFYVPVRSGCVDMVFKVINRPADAQVSVTAEGRTSAVTADQVDIVVPARVRTGFSLKCGDKKFDDGIIFDRPPVLGCFTLEAFPITIVYEPPGSSSSQKYSTSKTIGTTLENFTTKDSGTTEPVDTPFSTVTQVIGLLNTVGEQVEKVKPEVGKGMQAASAILSTLWGSSETDEKITNTVTDTHKLSIQMTNTDWQSTGTHQGPGKGDVFHFLLKPTFVWLAVQDEKSDKIFVTVALIGYQGAGSASAEDLRQGTLGIPSKDMQKLMLKLDPLAPEYGGGFRKGAASAQMNLLAGALPDTLGPATGIGRFVPADPFVYAFAGSQSGDTISRTIAEEDIRSEVKTDIITTTESGGLLGYVAKNVPHDGEKTVTTILGSSSGTSVSDTVQVEVTYGAAQGEGYEINVFYDTLFGTFAFREIPESEQQQMTGSAVESGGQPAANKKILLTGPDGLTTVGTTDDKGNFKLPTPTLQKGTYKLKIGDKEIPIESDGKGIKGLKVDTAAGTATGGEMASAGNAASSGTKTKVGKGGLDGIGGTTKPTVSETANTAGAIRGRPATNAAFTNTPNPKLKGRLGRIVVAFPKATPCKETHVAIQKAGSDAKIKSFYGSGEEEMLPGTYTVTVNAKPVADVTVQSKHDAKLSTGVLHVNAGKDTHVQLFDADGKTKLTSGYGEQQWGLPVGKYNVSVAGQSEAVEVKLDEVTEF
ncbi:MAG: hypothetical protein QOF78_4008 [Phycisphaerales bacterium]|nr:hypothetical protein [Phycisphaerales bacterium]